MRNILLVTLLMLVVATSAVSAAPPPPPDTGEGDWGWYMGCITAVYGSGAGPYTYRIWFYDVGKVGYYTEYTVFPYTLRRQLSAWADAAGNPMGVVYVIPLGVCQANGEPIGALDGKVSGHARMNQAPGVCPGAGNNDEQASATPLALQAIAYDSFTVALGNDLFDWYLLTGVQPAYTYRVTVAKTASESPVFFTVMNGGMVYPYYCTGAKCSVTFTAQPGLTYVLLEGEPNGNGNYAPPTPFCSKYTIRYSPV